MTGSRSFDLAHAIDSVHLPPPADEDAERLAARARDAGLKLAQVACENTGLPGRTKQQRAARAAAAADAGELREVLDILGLLEPPVAASPVRLHDPQGEFIGIGEAKREAEQKATRFAERLPREHGTARGFRQHLTADGDPCEECRVAYNADQRKRRAARKGARS